MVKLYSKDYKKELLRLVGNISQVGGVRRYELKEDSEKGVEAVDLHTGTGFNLTVLPGRGMDVSYAEYKEIPLCWVSPTGCVSPAYFEPERFGWLRSFFGGLLTTCGLTYLGQPCVDEGKELALHGRVSNLPAKNVYADGKWEGDDYIFWVQGKIRETAVFGENISLDRKIWTKSDENRFFVEDKIKNLAYSDPEHTLLYHFNIGFPLVDAEAKLIAPSTEVTSRDEEAKKMGEMDEFGPTYSGMQRKMLLS